MNDAQSEASSLTPVGTTGLVAPVRCDVAQVLQIIGLANAGVLPKLWILLMLNS